MKHDNKVSLIPRCLTVAGSDSGGGAGIQADLKTFSALDTFGMSVVTAITAQNTLGVEAIHVIPPEMIEKQFNAVFSDIGVDAIKIGMLGDERTITTLLPLLSSAKVPIVLDPVMVAKGGASLANKKTIAALEKLLTSCCTIATPNLPEAEVLLGMEDGSLDSQEDMKHAARSFYKKFQCSVLLKGGHLKGDVCVDVFFDGKRLETYKTDRIKTKNTHGTGCTLSSALAANLAKGDELFDAVPRAIDYVKGGITNHLNLGSGHGPLLHMWKYSHYGKPFTEQCWEMIANIYTEILNHPFIVGLESGSLPEESFQFFLEQDYLYLSDYRKGLEILAAKSDNKADELFLLSLTAGITEEQDILVEKFQVKGNRRKSAVCHLYTKYILEVVCNKPFAEGISVMLPCFWIYWKVGSYLAGRAKSPNPKYATWILPYSDAEDFASSTTRYLALVNKVASDSTEQTREKMKEHFWNASRFEYFFWHSAYEKTYSLFRSAL